VDSKTGQNIGFDGYLCGTPASPATANAPQTPPTPNAQTNYAGTSETPAPSASPAAPTPPAPTPPAHPATPPTQTNQQPNSDYGSGGHAVLQNDSSGAELHGTVYDSNNNLRHEETNTYATNGGGPEVKTEQHGYNYDIGGHLQLGWDLKYDLRGGLSYSDVTHYGLHGERTAEEITTYKPSGYEIKDWSIGRHQWYSDDITYKTPLPTGTATGPLTPTNTSLGVLFPRSYLPGETVTGSLWPSTYAEAFKTVPGLSEYSFSVPLYHLPDGSPEWSSLDIGVKGDGYVPINPNGTFSVHIPYDWKGPLRLQVRLDTPTTGVAPGNTVLNIDPPVAAPTLPDNLFSQAAHLRLHDDEEDYLVSLWEDACDIEERLDYLYGQANPDWERIFDLEDDLDWYYKEIDYIEDDLPASEVTKLAQEMLDEANSFHAWLGGKSNLTEDDKDDLDDCESWIDFLKNEIGHNKFLAIWGPTEHIIQPFGTNPVLTQGKLGVIRGTYPIDPYDTYVHIDKFMIPPLAGTPYNWYFMPPAGLTAGQHNYIIDSPLYSETIFPVFLMTLYMSADNLNLLKGQSTMYHVVLSGLNGLPGGAWSGSFDPTDLVPSSQLSAAQKAVGTSRTGYISLSITNGSPGVIAMQNQFLTYDAASFVPNGSHQTDGEVTALVRGNFTINGEAIAHLNPEIGVGIPPGTTVPSGLYNPMNTPLSYNWLPSFSVNYDQAAFSNSSFMTNSCPGSGATTTETTPTPTGGTPASTPCVESVINDLTPVDYHYSDSNMPGNAPSTVPVGDNTKPSDLDAAKERVDDARLKRIAAERNRGQAMTNEEDAWDKGFNNLSESDRKEFEEAQKRLADSFVKQANRSIEYDKNPTAENERLLKNAQEQHDLDLYFYRLAKESAVEKFSPADRQAWKAAHDAYQRALIGENDAENELRAANENLQKVQASTAN
jgi:hypothetical protein